ncbi:Protein Y45F10A.7 d [Aphelenchoides avenae]|nr:Protein Y45F10A.7 d [Aphelenchus avenae]
MGPSSSKSHGSVAAFNHALQEALYYDRLDNAKEFQEYLSLIDQAACLDIAQATLEERLAFSVNVYNLMLLHVAYKYGPPTTVWQRRKHFNCTYYLIGGHLYSLQSIQNGILRGNRKGIGMLWKPFGKDDLRRPYVIKGGEPLTHFAINNCTRSSPPLKMYSAEMIHEELLASGQRLLCSDEYLRLDTKKGSISVSKIFKIYAEDFGETPEEVIEWIISTLQTGDLKNALKMLYDSGDFSLHFIPLDLTTNMLRDICQ